MRRYAFIYNPAAGKGNSQKLAYLEKWIRKMPNARLFSLKQGGDIPELVDELLSDYDIFVACGGDGTARELASKLVGTSKVMGIIPMGTGNDLSKTLKIPSDLAQCFKMILNREPTRIDVGLCNDFIFLNSLGFGFDGLTNRYAEDMRQLPPFLRYISAALKASIYQNEFLTVIEEDREFTEEKLIMLTVANGRVEGGSFWIAPEASVTDGELHLIRIQPIRKWIIPFLLPLFLIKKAYWIPHAHSQKIKSITVQFKNDVAIHADGEIIKSNKRKFFIRMIPNSLQVICGL